MANPRLNWLSLLYIYTEIDLDIFEIIDLFTQKKQEDTTEIAVNNEVFKSKVYKNSQFVEKGLRISYQFV